MYIVLLLLMIGSGLLFTGSVLLMSPKGGLGFGLGGVSSSNEYGSKKSVEYTLKKVAKISLIVFIVSVFALPYVNN
ncbi:MAG: preprotein translocase subunit SecG [Candidatus Absconditabacteria bacterium]